MAAITGNTMVGDISTTVFVVVGLLSLQLGPVTAYQIALPPPVPPHSQALQMPQSFPGQPEQIPRAGPSDEFTKRILDLITRHTLYANTLEEIGGDMHKRTEGSETHVGGCAATRIWIPLGSNHYPRFIKSYNCTSANCDHNFGQCEPKQYSVKVLQRKTSESATLTEEDCDPNLPPELRCTWKLAPVTVTTYCECKSSGLATFGRKKK